jgi:ABC-type transporter Mla MlaB component
MASNFHVFSYETRDTLHLKLSGDFDGTSAFQLLERLKKQKAEFDQIFIDVNNLKTIYPFALEVFQKEMNSYDQKTDNFIFLGKNGYNFSLN